MRKISIKNISIFLFSIICCSGFSAIMPIRMALILVFILLMVFINVNHWKIPLCKSLVFIPYLLLTIYIGISVIYSYQRTETIKFLIVYFAGAVMILFPSEESFHLKCQKCIELLCKIVAGSILIQILIPNLYSSYLYFLIQGGSTARQRLAGEVSSHIYSGIVGEKGEAAFLMVIAVIIILARSVSEKKISRSNKIWLVIYFIAMLLPAKRMLFIVGILMVLIYVMFWTRGSKKLIAVCSVGMAGVFGYIAMSITPALNTLMMRFTSFADDDTANGRIYLWEHAINMFREKTILGYGYGSYNTYASEKGVYLTESRVWTAQAHNIYYQLLGETGIIGTLLFVFVCIAALSIFLKLYKVRKNMNESDIMLLFIGVNLVIMTLVYGITGNVIYYTNQIMFFFWGISIGVYLYHKYLKIKKFNKKE